jgi:hypothetical protein
MTASIVKTDLKTFFISLDYFMIRRRAEIALKFLRNNVLFLSIAYSNLVILSWKIKRKINLRYAKKTADLIKKKIRCIYFELPYQ